MFICNQLCISIYYIDIEMHKLYFQSEKLFAKSDLIRFELGEIQKDNTFRWIEVKKEFIFKGEMYDIKRTQLENHKIIFLCKPDRKEFKLFSRLKAKIISLSLGSDESTGKIPKNFSFLMQDLFANNHLKQFHLRLKSISNLPFGLILFLKDSLKIQVDTPPPNI